MTAATLRKLASITHRLAEQQAWIERCGGDLGGYIDRYGWSDSPTRVGDGGAAIFEADIAELRRLADEYDALRERINASTRRERRTSELVAR